MRNIQKQKCSRHIQFVVFIDYMQSFPVHNMQSFSVHYLQSFLVRTYYFCWIVVKHWLLGYFNKIIDKTNAPNIMKLSYLLFLTYKYSVTKSIIRDQLLLVVKRIQGKLMYIKKGNMTYFGRQLDFMAVDLHIVLGLFL